MPSRKNRPASAGWTLLACAFALAFFTSIANAETSADYARYGRLIWSAFKCAAAAEDMEDFEERGRLFALGYQRGNVFLDALAAGQIDEADWNSTVPVGVVLLLEGPSHDFILGRIWESAVNDYYDWRQEACGWCSGDEASTLLVAAGKFGEMNCGVLQ